MAIIVLKHMWTLMQAVYASGRLQFLIVANRPMNIATGIFTPWLFMVLYTLPRVHSASPSDLTSSIAASLIASLWSASIWSGAGIIRREKWMGTLGFTLSSSLNPFVAIISKVAGAVIYDTILIVLSISAFCFLFRLHIQLEHPALSFMSLFLVIIFGISSSLLLSGLLILSRNPFYITNIFGTPILLLGGVLIPPQYLPAWCSWISRGVNLYWLREFINTLSDADPNYMFLLFGLIISAIYLIVAYGLLQKLLARAKKEASFELS